MTGQTDDSGQDDLFDINETKTPALRTALARMNEQRQAHPGYEAGGQADVEEPVAPKPKEPKPPRRRWAKEVEPNLDRDDRIIPARIAMFDGVEGDSRSRLFSPAMHAVMGGDGRQQFLPGFEHDVRTPALPLALYELGVNHTSPGPGAPVALRLFVESILAAPYHERDIDQPVSFDVPMRALVKRLWPNRRRKRNEWLPVIADARDVLASRDAGIPWPGGVRWAVTMTNLPIDIADDVRLVVDLPPGAKDGPQVSSRLHLYGPQRGKHYRALLNLAYWWHEPGRTLVPADGGPHWLRVNDPHRYRKPNDAELVNLVFPTPARRQFRKLRHEAQRVLADLRDDGELREVDGKLLPPISPKSGGRSPDARGQKPGR